MTIAQTLHTVRLLPPFYQQDIASSHCGLHRYLDDDFINRFKQDLQRQQFTLPQFQQWQEDERHSPHDRLPVLRLPLHRAFHLVCCEVVCDRPGFPALDPQKITSAGFVIRRKIAGQDQAWILQDGEAVGWQAASSTLHDPDIHRRLCASGILGKRSDEAAYSGEETFPLHVQNIQSRHSGRLRTHTLLFGYLPLGGFYYHRDASQLVDEASQKSVAATTSLRWPFGYNAAGAKLWQPEFSQPVNAGRPSKPFFELLRLLVNRYHLGEVDLPDNELLENYFSRLFFYDLRTLPVPLQGLAFNEGSALMFTSYQRDSLWQYLQKCFARQGNNPLVRWLIEQEKKADAVGGLDRLTALDPLPASNGNGVLNHSVLLLASQAEEIRTLLDQRLQQQTLSKVKEIPLPKFGQGKDDQYQIIPFVRHRNDGGREQIQWASHEARSLPFRVAAPFDPEASRPAVIQMPSLADLRRGLARGASMITPADTFNLINSLKLGKGASADILPDSQPGPGNGIQWICSFSLPVITLVAMILLMIMVSLLNLVFFWLPWVRICLPFPKLK